MPKGGWKSERQRRYMHAKHPEIAARWEKEFKSKGLKSKAKAEARKRVKK